MFANNANDVPMKANVELGDSLTERIRESILGLKNLSAENCRLTDEFKSLEGTNLQLESEVQWLKLALDHERAQRRHYHSLANEIITRLDVVGQSIDGVVKRAEQETYRHRREPFGAIRHAGGAPRAAVDAFYARVCRSRRAHQLRSKHCRHVPSGRHLRRPHPQGREARRPADFCSRLGSN